MRLPLKLALAFTSCFILSAAFDNENDIDTVVINASEDGGKEFVRQKRQFQVLNPSTLPAPVHQGSLEGSPCDSLKNERGVCSTVSQCYPLIFSAEGEENRNPGLVDVFKESSGVCEPLSTAKVVLLGLGYRSVVRSPNELICCTSGQMAKNPFAKPVDSSAPAKFVVGGSPADITKFPWAVSLFVRNRHSCGGSLITKNTVLTAAHCVKDLSPTDIAGMKIYLGHHDISASSTTRGLLEVRTAAQVKYHRGFSMRTLQDDIALIILNSAAPVDNNVKITPVALSATSASDTMATVAGWGQTFWGSATSSRLLEATMDIWTQLKCQEKYRGFQAPVTISTKQVCAGSPGKDSCRGDSGGPLHVQRDNAYVQIGIVSFGGMCGEYPGVYTRVASYTDWIQRNRKE
jgi:hypothetical protein